MALERFIPKSPDMFIRNSQDFEVAKFGHLNTIVEYINSYIGSDSLQLAGSGPITSTARYISDSTGVNSAISISTIRVGIGTDIPSAELHIDGHNGFGASLKITTNKVNSVAYVQMISDYVTGFEQYQYGGPGWGWPNWTTTRAGGTAAAPTAVPNNYGLNEYTFWGHDGTAGGQAYAMMTRSSETWTPTAHGIYTIFSTVATGSTSLVERMRFSAGGNITFNNASDTAKVSIKGSGSTSATTALLVQNSATTQLFRVYDNGTTDVGVSLHFLPSGIIATDFGSLQLQGASRVQINNNEVLANSDNFLWANSNFLPSNTTRNNFQLVGNGSSFTNGGASGTSIGNALSIPIGMSTSVGNVTLNHININGTINTTGGTTLQRGFYYNPTLTGTVGFTHRAIETVTGDVLLGTTSGRVGIGTSTPSAPLEVRGLTNNSVALRIGGLNTGRDFTFNPYYATNTYGGLFSNESGNITLGASLGTDNGSGIGIILGAPSGTRTALLQVKGTGSTSATTSLLVQNSAGNRLLETKDNGDLYVGNTASNTGTIFVPYSSTYGDRVFMRIDGGFPLFSTISNALLEITCTQFYTQGNMAMKNANQGIIGVTAVEKNNSSIQLTTAVNAYNGTSQDDACNLLYVKNNGVTLQANGSVNFIKLDGQVNEAGGGGAKWCTGIYYNPTLTGGTALANSHYCYHATSGQMMVNTTSPQSSAQLQVDSTTRGFLMPRMTTAEINAIASPANGLEVYNTTLAQPCFYDGVAWRKVTHSTM